MSKNDFEIIFLKEKKKVINENDLIEFEKLLYNNFQKNQWVMDNYKIIDGNRMQPPVNYDDIVLLIAKKNNKIIAGISGNINSDSYFQAEQMGFEIKHKNISCEGLNFFIIKDYRENILNIIGALFDKIVEILKNETNIKYVYTTCPDDLLKMYKIVGFDLISEKIISGKKKYLLRLDIEIIL